MYRHDNLQQTGVAVDVVDRNPDDFGPFGGLLSKADTRTPPCETGEHCFVFDVKDKDGEIYLSSMLDLPSKH